VKKAAIPNNMVRALFKAILAPTIISEHAGGFIRNLCVRTMATSQVIPLAGTKIQLASPMVMSVVQAQLVELFIAMNRALMKTLTPANANLLLQHVVSMEIAARVTSAWTSAIQSTVLTRVRWIHNARADAALPWKIAVAPAL
jgi:hypothetical protein